MKGISIIEEATENLRAVVDEAKRSLGKISKDVRNARYALLGEVMDVPSPDSLMSRSLSYKRIYAVPPVEAGYLPVSQVILRGERKIPQGFSPLPRTKRQIIKLRTLVRRQEIPYWQEQGWYRSNGSYRGYYKTPYGRWRGRIERVYLGNFDYYVYDPPYCLEHHPHWPCFRYQGDGQYLLHFSRKTKDISSGIMIMEQLITEAYRG